MALSLLNILCIVLALVLGLECHRFGIAILTRHVDRLSNLCLYALLVFMGITIGQVPDFFDMLFEVGVTALVLALATSTGVALVLCGVFSLLAKSKRPQRQQPSDKTIFMQVLGFLKEPLILMGLVSVGFIVAYTKFIPDIQYDLIVTLLLYLLIVTVGIKLSQSDIRLVHIVTHKVSVVVALCTIAGSYLGAWAVSHVIELNMAQTLAISSGFGWYTLSGILFAKLGYPVLGSVAFMTDLFREMLGLLLLPMLARFGMSKAGIGICGSTAMDVSLPVIEKYGTRHDVTLGFISGTLITLVVPFLIPLLVSFQ